jgi:DNA polymerase-3 subunit delta
MLTRYADFERSLQKVKLATNYFLFGPDTYLVEQARCAVVRAAEGETQGQLAPATVDLDEVSVDELLNSAQSLSLFAPRQVILVKSVMKLRENHGKKLGVYLADPNPQTLMMFLAGNLDRDQRKKKIFEILSSGTKVVELAPLEGQELVVWIHDQAHARGFSIEPVAVDLLLETQGRDLGRLQQELEKAMLYAGSEKQITLAMLEALLGFAVGHTLSEFLDAVVSRNKRKALGLVDEIFFSGKETGLAFWWFGQQLRQWLQFNELAGKTSPAIIGKQVGVYSPSVAIKMTNQARQFSNPGLLKAISRLADVDDKMKRSSPDTRFAMDLLVHELTGQASRS